MDASSESGTTASAMETDEPDATTSSSSSSSSTSSSSSSTSCELDDGCLEPVELPPCDAGDALSQTIQLPFEIDGVILTLAFGDAVPGGGDELLLVGTASAWIVTEGGTSLSSPAPFGDTMSANTIAVRLDGDRTGFALHGFDLGLRIVTHEAGEIVVSAPQILFPGSLGTGPGALLAGDIDADGIDDLVARSERNTVQVLFGTGSDFALGPAIASPGLGRPVVGHFDADATADIAVHDEDGTTGIFIDGRRIELPGGSSPERELATGDFDGDGDADLVGLTRDADLEQVLLQSWQQADGAWTLLPASTTPEPFPPPARLWNAVGDFDGDDVEDLALGTPSGVRLYFGDSSGEALFRCYAGIATDDFAVTLAAGDLDGDGIDELALGGTQLSILAHES